MWIKWTVIATFLTRKKRFGTVISTGISRKNCWKRIRFAIESFDKQARDESYFSTMGICRRTEGIYLKNIIVKLLRPERGSKNSGSHAESLWCGVTVVDVAGTLLSIKKQMSFRESSNLHQLKKDERFLSPVKCHPNWTSQPHNHSANDLDRSQMIVYWRYIDKHINSCTC